MADFFTPFADRALEEANAAVETAKSNATKSILPAPSTPAAPPQPAQLDPNLLRDFESAAIKHNVPVDVLMAMAEKDSGFDPLARSRGPGSKTRGIINLSDEDVAKHPGANPYVATQAIEIAAGKLRSYLDSGKSLSDALKAVAAGPNADQWGPQASEYADDIMARSQHLLSAYEQQTAPPPAPAPAPAPAAPPERPGILAQAAGDVVRGVKGLKNTGVGLAALAAEAGGFDSWADDLLKTYIANEKDIAENNKPVIGSYKNIKGLGDAGRYAIEAVAENLPMMAGTLGAGAVGGMVARKIAQRAVTDMIEKQVAEGVAKNVAERNVADYVTRRTVAGAAGGAYAGSAGMESGSIFGDVYRETGQKRPGIAAGFGAVAGALDAIEPIMAIKKVAGPAVTNAVVGGLVKRLGIEGAKQFAAEAGTEGLQTIIEKAATTATDGRTLFTPELLDEVIDSALKGGIAGGGMGVASQAASEVRARGEAAPAAPAAPPRDPSAMLVSGSPQQPPPAAPAAPTPAPGPTPPAPPAPAAPGPLSRVMNATAPDAAPLAGIVGQRAVMTDEMGQMAGHVVEQDAENVTFKGDDGQEYVVPHGDLTSGAVSIAPAADAPTQEAPTPLPPPEAGPSPESLAAAAEGDLSDKAVAKAPTTPPAREEPRSLAAMSEPELRERLKAIHAQAKAGSGWNKTLVQARRKVESEIEARKAAAPQGETNAAQEAEQQPTAGVSLQNDGAGSSERGGGVLSGPEGAKAGAASDSEGGRDDSAGVNAAGGEGLVRAGGVAESKPSLTEDQAKAADYAKRNWWGARAAAASFIENKGLGETHEIKQTGERKFQVVPKAEGGTVAFPAESGTLGVPRAEMPQVKSQHHGALVNHLNANGIAHETTEVPAADLKPTQAEYSPEKVEAIKEEGVGDRAVIVSNDGHIIDGHHQAVAAAEKGENVKAIVLDAPVKEALEAVKSAPMAQTAEGEKPKAAASVPDSAFNGDLEHSLNGVFLSDEYDDKNPVPLLNRGFSPDEIAALERAGMATDGAMSRAQWEKWSEERGARISGRKKSAPKSEPAAAPKADIKFRDLVKITERTAGNDAIKRLHIGEFRVFAERASPYAVAEGYGKTPEEARANARRALEPKSAEPDAAPANNPETKTEAIKPFAPKHEDGHFHAGWSAQQRGEPRKLPSYFTIPNNKNAKNWFRGYDAAANAGERPLTANEALSPKPLEPAIAKGELPVIDDRERQRRENAAKMDAINAEWWDKELTGAGRRQAAEAAGVKIPNDRVLWKSLDERSQVWLERIRLSDMNPAREKPALEEPAGPAPEWAQDHARAVGGDVVWHDGEVALIRGFSALHGRYLYSGAKGGERTAVDIQQYSGKAFTERQREKLFAARAKAVEADEAAHAANPDGPFKDGKRFAASPNFPPRLAEYAESLLKMLGIETRIYVTTVDDARDGERFAGPFAAINSAALNEDWKGSARKMATGDYVVAIRPSARLSASMETLAHEFGHILETVAFNNADPETKAAIRSAYNAWAAANKKSTLGELVNNLRTHTIAKQANFRGRENEPTDRLPAYWRSFNEWFADQVARWAVSSDKPLTLADKFFDRIGKAMRRLYASVSGRRYLPAEEMKRWLDARGPAMIVPAEPPPAPAPEKPAKKGKAPAKKPASEKSYWTEIGKNEIGQTLYEDQRGIRSYIENGVRHSEPVGMRPTRGGMDFSTNRDAHPEYLTAEEMAVRKPITEEAPKTEETVAPSSTYGANNKLVSKDRAEELKKRLKQKFKDAGTQFNSGIDPEFLAIGTELAAFHLEAGARKFADFAKTMSGDLGISITNLKPYLRSWYNGARDMIEDAGLDISGMEGPDTVRTELARLLKEDAAPPKKTADQKQPKTSTGERRLRLDWGVDNIDGWTELPGGKNQETDYGLRGGVKDAFLKDARDYLRAVEDNLVGRGFKRALDKKGKAQSGVRVNEAGPAVSGEAWLNLSNPDTNGGIFVQVDAGGFMGSGIHIMYRVNNGVNRFPVSNLTADELAEKIAGEVESIAPKEQKNEPAKLDEPSESPLDGVSADEVQGTEAERDARTGSSGRGGADVSGNERPDGGRIRGTRGVGNGARGVSVPARGTGTEGEGGQGAGSERSGEDVQRDRGPEERDNGEAGRGRERAVADAISGFVYHGTARNNTAFDKNAVAYFATDEGVAREHALNDGQVDGGTPVVIKAKLNIKKPAFLPVMVVQDLHQTPDLVKSLIEQGFDSAIADSGDIHEIAVFGNKKIIVKEIVSPSAGIPAGNAPSDFAIGEEDRIGEGGAKAKFRQNVVAIKLLRILEKLGRPATRDEQAVLAKWVGWGGLPQAFERSDKTVSKGWEKEVAELRDLLTPEEMSAAQASTRNAHYTSPEIVKAMWDALRHMGFNGGRVLEPSVGAGNFFGLMPTDMRSASQLHGVELDHITGGIAKNLYPGAKIAAPMGFQDFTMPDGYFDAVIGNPPFGSEKLYDPLRKDLSKFSIHNYFFAKALDGLKPGGVMTMVVTNRMLDAYKDEARQYLAERADLVAAIRLPNDAFLSNAGTQVTTDIIILRKRKEGEAEGPNYFGEVIDYTDKNGDTVPLNVYFHNHPENMLGEFGNFGTMYAGRGRGETESALVAREGQDTAALLAAAISRLPRDITTGSAREVIPESIPVTADLTNVRVGSMFLQGGEVLVRDEDSLGEPRASKVEFPSDKARERVAGMIGVRDAFADVRRLQLDPAATDKAIEDSRARLNTVYDAFVKQNSFINVEANKRLFRDDPSWPQISALENDFEKGVTAAVAKSTGDKPRAPRATKAAVFTRRTQSPFSPPTTAASAKDALVSSLAERGRVDLDLMERLYGKSRDAILTELGDLVFDDPVRGVVTRDEYLSGNVKQKLAEAEQAAKNDESYRRNVEALKAVQPEDIPAAQIEVKAGAHWIPRHVMIEFTRHIAGGRKSDAFYNAANGKWVIDADETQDARVRWATTRTTVSQIITAAASQKALTIYDRFRDGSSDVNEKETQAANDKVQAVADEWKRWLFDDDNRREELARLYNDMFNTDIKRSFDGSHLSFPGKVGNDIVSLRPHQSNAIWRIIQSPTTLLDHVVGAGKTFTMIGAIMEGKRIGLMRKPVLVVPNHLVSQWAADFVRLYPSANILAASKKDFEKENRKRLFARIATGDWDAVIVAHSSFGKVEVDPLAQAEFIEKQVADMIRTQEAVRAAEGKDGRNVKKIQEAIAKKREKMKKLLDTGRKDDSLYFNELGIDALLVDEAHEFKNLEYSTSMNRVAGLGSQKGSQKASDLYLKVDQILKATGGRNIVFATGTPISNTMAEMFTMQRYLDGKRLEEQGLGHFDAWARMFGEIVSDFEISPAGKFKMNSRFSKFTNLPELLQRYTSFADVINRDDINAQLAAQGKKLPVPKIKGGKPQNIVVERSAAQAAYVGEPIKNADGEETGDYPKGSLIWRSENLPKGQPQKGDDNMLKIMSDARKAALDMRLIDPSYADHPGSKVNDAANRIKAIYDKWHADKGAQLVFIDLSTPKNAMAKEARAIRELLEQAEAGDDAAQEKLDAMSPDDFLALDSQFSVYDYLKEKLIAKGIPENEIEFIHSANTDQQKADLFAKVRNGSIRVLFGSTAKMGAGMNVQDRLVALHHLDAPWRPSDLEQREGRIIRQGNKLYERDPEGFEVEVLRYATKMTLDARMWQTIEGKANFIEQIRKGTGERTIEDIGGEAMNSAEMKAAASGNPLILEAMSLNQKIKKLKNEEYNHRTEQWRIRDLIRWNDGVVLAIEKRLASLKEDLKVETPKDFAMNVRGETFKKRKDAGERLLKEANEMLENGAEETLVGSYGGFKLWMVQRTKNVFRVLVKGAGTYETTNFTADADPQGVAQRVLNEIPGPAGIKDDENSIVELNDKTAKLKMQIGEWTKRDELETAQAAYSEIMAQLKPKKPAAPPKAEEGENTENGEGDEAKASVGAGGGNLTAADLRDHLVRGKDGPLIAKMIDAGRIVLHDAESALPGSPPAGAQGVTEPNGTIHLVAANLTPETARAVLLHEAFHAGGAALTGGQGWKALMARVRVAVDGALERGDTEGFWAEALDQARASGGPLAEEVAAYVIENYEQAPAGLRDIADRLIGVAKAWALRFFGRQFGDVTPAQLRALAVAALRSSEPPGPTTDGPGGLRYSIRSRAAAAARAKGIFEKMDAALGDFITNRIVSPSAQPSDTGRNSILAAVPVRALFLEVAKDMPTARHYIDTKAAMDAERNKLAQETDVILQRWFKWANRITRDGLKPKFPNREENARLMDLMHDTTVAGVDPSKAWTGQEEMTPADRDVLRNAKPGSKAHDIALEKQARDAERKRQWDAFKVRYDALPSDAKAIYNEVRDAYRAMADETERLVLENMKRAVDASVKKAENAHEKEMKRIADDGLTGKDKAEAIKAADERLMMAKTRAKRNKAARLKRMREEFEKNRVKEPYFPLTRFGSYFVTVRDQDNKVVSFSRFESAGDQRRFAEEMRKDPLMNVEVGVAEVAADYQNAIDPQFMANLDSILEGGGVPMQVRDQVWQRYLESLPDLSMRKHRIHRKGRAGFNTDALRAFAHVMFHGGHQMARLKYGIDLQEHLDEIAKEAKAAPDPVRAGAVYNEMVKAHDFSMNPEGSSFSHRISSMAFLWTMAFNLSSALVNIEQTWSKGVPVIAFDADLKAGNKKAVAELARAARDFYIGKGHVEDASTLTADERRAIRTGYELGTIDKTQAHDLASVSESGVSYNPIINNVMKAAAWPMHQTERFNREITFLAAYRLARASGLGHEKAIGKAADLTWMTHYDNQSTSKPRFMRGDWQRIAFALKGFQANVIFRVFWDAHEAMKGADKETRKLALGRFATTIALSLPMAGLSGAFAMHTLMAIAAFFMGMLGSDDDPEEELRRIVMQTTGDSIVGQAVGGMMMDGVPGYITGTALSDRIGTADLWFRSTNRDFSRPEQKWLYVVDAIGGAPVGLLHQIIEAGTDIGQGNVGRGVEKVLPAAARNALKAIRYATEGVTDKDGNPIVEYVPVQDIVKQTIGFTPAAVKEQMDRNAFQTRTQKRIETELSTARREAARAQMSGDEAAIAAAEKKVDAANEKYPEAWIKPKSIMQTIRGMESRKDRMDFGVELNPKLEERIKGATAPSVYRR